MINNLCSLFLLQRYNFFLKLPNVLRIIFLKSYTFGIRCYSLLTFIQKGIAVS